MNCFIASLELVRKEDTGFLKEFGKFELHKNVKI